MAGNESLPQWAIANENNPRVRLYFSPSCPACRDALLAFGGSAALCPVSENDDDTLAILRLEALLNAKVPMAQAIERCRDPQEPLPKISPFRRALVSAWLLRNKAAVFKQGFTSLPLLQVNGMPSLPGKKDPPAAAAPQNAETRESRSPASEQAQPSFLAPPNMSPRQPVGGTAGQTPDGALPWDVNDLGQCKQNSSQPCADPRQRP